MAEVVRSAGLAGKVTTASGPLTATARVCATCVSCEITGTSDQICADTAADGSYELMGLGASGYRISAAAHGFAIGSANDGKPIFLAPSARREGVDIVLAVAGERVAGVVVDAMGGPVAEAQVRIVSWGQPATSTEVKSGPDGSFEAFTLAGRVTAIANANGYASGRVHRIAPSSDLTIMLTPEASISGTAVLLEDGRPVAGASIAAQQEGFAASGSRETVSDEEGNFLLAGLEPGRYHVVGSAPGLRPSLPQIIELGIGDQVRSARVALVAAAQVKGRVLIGDSQQPCSQGQVLLGPPHPSIAQRPGSKWTNEALGAFPAAPATLAAPIDGDGQVHFHAVPPGHYFVSVICDGHLQHAGQDTLKVQSEDVEGLVWYVSAGTRLSVRVVDQSGQPVPRAVVDLYWPSSETQGGGVTTLECDASGRSNAVDHLYPGLYTARVAGGYESDPTPVEIKLGAPPLEITLRAKGGAAIEITAQDKSDRPVDGLSAVVLGCAPVAPHPTDTTPSAARWQGAALGAGRYRVGPLPAGCYRVELSDLVNPTQPLKGAGNLGEIQLRDGEKLALRASLDRSAKVEGRVVSADGSPVADVWVSASASGDAKIDPVELSMRRSSMHQTGRTLSDHDGRFALGELDPGGSYDLVVEQPAGASKLQPGVRPGANVVISLPATGAIAGIVTDARGAALDDFSLRVVELETQRMSSRTFSRSGGRFELSGVSPGELEIQAIEPSGQVALLKTELKSGQKLSGLRLALSN